MSNKKRISKFTRDKEYTAQINSLNRKLFYVNLENAMLRGQIAILASQSFKKENPSGGFIKCKSADKEIVFAKDFEQKAAESWSVLDAKPLDLIQGFINSKVWDNQLIIEKRKSLK